MDSKLIQFIESSLRWSSVRRGRDMAELAAKSLRDLFQIENGFFVYRQRQVPRKPEDLLPQVYAPWGEWGRAVKQVANTINWNYYFANDVLPQAWVAVDEMKDVLPYRFLKKYGVDYIGVWPIKGSDEHFGAMVVGRRAASMCDDDGILKICAGQISLILEMLRTFRKVEEISKQDSLTGLLNRRGMLDEFEAFLQSLPSGQQIVLGVLDIDDFKSINDTRGHLEGDRVLMYTGQILMESVGDNGLAARWGGDEMVFVVKTSLGCEEIAETIRHAFVQSNQLSHRVSVGTALWGVDGDDWDACFKAADERLYAYRTRQA